MRSTRCGCVVLSGTRSKTYPSVLEDDAWTIVPSMPTTEGSATCAHSCRILSKNCCTPVIGAGLPESSIPHIKTPPPLLAKPEIAFARFFLSSSSSVAFRRSRFDLNSTWTRSTPCQTVVQWCKSQDSPECDGGGDCSCLYISEDAFNSRLLNPRPEGCLLSSSFRG